MLVIKVSKMLTKFLKLTVLFIIIPILLNSCKGPDGKFKLPGGDARKFPADPEKRVEQNLKQGKGFQLNETFGGGKKGGVFDFASSNALWRASLDVVDFMPLSSVNYSGGIIITDWYSSSLSSNENIKISIRFLTNEIRSDALNIKIFKKICDENNRCVINESVGELNKELQRKILQKAKIYETQKKDKNFKPYDPPKLGN